MLGAKTSFQLDQIDNDFDITTNFTQYVVGSFVLAICLSLLFGFVGYAVLSIFKWKKTVVDHE